MSYLSDRIIALQEIHKQAAHGGIVIHPGELRAVEEEFSQAVSHYHQAQIKLVKCAHPKHYRLVVWGSARLHAATPEHEFTKKLTQALVEQTECDIITGGGPGIMQAALEGGVQARRQAQINEKRLHSKNIGINIQLPFEQEPNPFIDYYSEHAGFSTRLDEFISMSNAVYVAPGRIGSALELMYPLQLIQVGHLEKEFLVIVHPFWKPILDAMKKTMFSGRAKKGQVPLVSSEDFDRIVISDDIPEIVSLIEKNHSKWLKNIHEKVKSAMQ